MIHNWDRENFVLNSRVFLVNFFNFHLMVKVNKKATKQKVHGISKGIIKL